MSDVRIDKNNLSVIDTKTKLHAYLVPGQHLLQHQRHLRVTLHLHHIDCL